MRKTLLSIGLLTLCALPAAAGAGKQLYDKYCSQCHGTTGAGDGYAADRVAVAGAHGKTTTTAMIAAVLTRGRLDPTVVIGGRIGSLRSGAKLGGGEIMVAEADESDGSFLKMKPTIAVVTNIDREHLDHYGNLAAIQNAFVSFLSRVPFYGVAIVCRDEPHVQAILPRIDPFQKCGVRVQNTQVK